LRGLAQRRIEGGQFRQLRPGMLQHRQARRLALLQRRQCHAGAFQQRIGVAEAAMFLFRFLPAGGVKTEGGQLPDLPLEQLAFARRGLDILFGLGAGFARRAPCRPGCRHLPRQRLRPGIEQLALGIGAQQAVMGVLAVDVGQEIGGLAQLGQRRRHAVDVAARAAVRLDHAPQQAGIVVEIVGLQPALQGLPAATRTRRRSRPSRPLRTAAGIGALAQRQGQRIDQDRLAGAGLAGQGAEAGGEFQLQLVDDDVVADIKARSIRQ
jgi:hypothetical protein